MGLLQTPRGPLWVKDYRQRPDQPATIFVHGAGATHMDFPVQLRRHPQVGGVALDLPGHGESPGAGRSAIEDYAADVIAVLDALQIEAASVIGHSMGGAIAQMMALHWPQHVRRLVLLSTGARLPVNEAILNGIVHNTEETAALIVKWSWARTAPDDLRQMGIERLIATDPAITQADFAACNAFDVTSRLPQIACPALIVCGTADKMTPPAWSEQLAAAIPDATLRLIDGGGHMVALEQPEAVAQLIARWLNFSSMDA